MISRSFVFSMFCAVFAVGSSFFAAGTALADTAPPTSEMLVHFLQNGQLVTSPVDFTLTCSVRADADPRSSRFVTLDFAGHCTDANCRIDTSDATYYFQDSTELIKDCSVKGTVAGVSFQVDHALLQKPDTLICKGNYDMLIGNASGEHYYLYTSAYNTCVAGVREKYHMGGDGDFACNAFRKQVKTCGVNSRCLSIGGKFYEETPASEACIQREMAEEDACLALATNVTGKLDKSADGEVYETACNAIINLPATVNTAPQGTIAPMMGNTTSSMNVAIDATTLDVAPTPTPAVVPQRSFFGRLLDRVSCFFVHVFGGICVGETR